MLNYIWTAFICLVCASIGNLVGDQATIKDCATKGTATMMGGGTVSCYVNPEPARVAGRIVI